MSDKNGNNVKWFQLIAIIGIVGTLLGALWTKLEKINDIMVQNQIELGEIKTDVGWLRTTLERFSSSPVSVKQSNLLDRMHNERAN